MIERSRAVRESDAVFDLDEGHSAETPRLTRVKHPHLNVPGFDEVLHAPRVKAVLQDLLGPTVRLQTTKLNTKAPGGGAAVEWHQDWAFYPHTNDDLLAIGLILADVDEANGPLMVIPGSHKGPTLDHTRNGVFAGAIDPSDPAFDLSKAVTLTGRAGSMSIHHVRLLHGSAPNMSDRARLICFYELAAGDAWPLGRQLDGGGRDDPAAGLGLDRPEHLLRPTQRHAQVGGRASPPAAAAGTRQRLDLQDPEKCRGRQRLRHGQASRRCRLSAVDGPGGAR